MKTINLLIGLSLLLTVSNCDLIPWPDYDIYLDHSQWFKYNLSDTLVFCCNTEDNDTFIITDIFHIFYTWDRWEYEALKVEYSGKDGCENCPLESFARDSRFRDNVGISGQFPTVYFEFTDFFEWHYVHGDRVLRKVYIEREIPVMDSINDKVGAIYYSHDFGVFRYDMHDGRVYELQIK